MSAWKHDWNKSKNVRLGFLIQKLGLEGKNVDEIRYQLLHRTAVALIEAEKITASKALLLVHSFNEQDQPFADFADLIALYGLEAPKISLLDQSE